MAEDPLQRIVQFVRDAGHELSERGELLRLGQPPAQRLPLGFELRLRRQVARNQHGPDALSFLIEQVGDRHHERAVQYRIHESRNAGS